ncbi:MAG TPA: ATP-binding cassette domain-containing protein [Methylococcaceae bacterium]|nr:ATP-binding cassette domain-containing protein [Methylococcaceae bacterium]
MTPAYRLQGVSWSYDGLAPALQLDELGIESAGLIALVGPNGAGKTTLLEILAFLKAPHEGRIEFFGQPVPANCPLATRRRVTLLTQHPKLFDGSVLDNVALGLKLRGVAAPERLLRARAALEQVGAEQLAARKARELSGGERQLVALARAVALDTEVLLCDEPFAALESAAATRVEQVVTRLAHRQGRTVVFSTHDQTRGMALADRVVSLVAGRAVAAPLINLFHGEVRDGAFRTAKIDIHLPGNVREGRHLLVHPEELILSLEPLDASLRNRFHGRVTAVAEQGAQVLVGVEAGECFQALVTREAFAELHLAPGAPVWVSFKATALRVL